MSKNKKRPQAPKGENKAMAAAMMGKRTSSAAGFHTPKTSYRRKPKHHKGWE